MREFYFFRTKKLLEVLSKKIISDQIFLLYVIYLLTLFIVFIFSPSIVLGVSEGNLQGKKIQTTILQVCIFSLTFFAIRKMSDKSNVLEIIKSYIAIYSTQAVSFFLIRIMIGFIVLYVFAVLRIPTDSGFVRSHYPSLMSEVISVCSAEIIIQLIMFFRFSQLNRMKIMHTA